MKFFLTKMKLVVEPSGGASTAAVLSGKLPQRIGKIGVIVSGGNVDLG
jgi:threonine dehydratase